jgi:hypothetical protein
LSRRASPRISRPLEWRQSQTLDRIGYRGSDTGKQYSFFTNFYKLAARPTAVLYVQRWQITINALLQRVLG